MDFQGAITDYRFAAMKYDMGRISEEKFLSDCEDLIDTDGEGRRWRIEPRSGQWQVEKDGAWEVDIPPGLESSDAERYHNIKQIQQASYGKWFLAFGLVVGGVNAWQDPSLLSRPQELGMIVLGCTFFIWFISWWQRSDAWSGRVVDLYTTYQYRRGAANKSTRWAVVDLDTGGTTTTYAMPEWEIGDRLEKPHGMPQAIRYED